MTATCEVKNYITVLKRHLFVYLLFKSAILLSQNYVSVTVALLKRQPKTGECWLQLWVSCRVPSSVVVVTVHRVLRQLQMSRLDSTRLMAAARTGLTVKVKVKVKSEE